MLQIVDIVGMYKYPEQERYEIWCVCRKRSCTVYLDFPDGWKDYSEVEWGLMAAIEKDTRAIRMIRKNLELSKTDNAPRLRVRDRFEFSVCEFKPNRPHFNSDFRVVDHQELVDIKELTENVRIVSLHGEQFVYKFMTPKCYQNIFEDEEQNYRKLAGVPGIPELRAVVRKEGIINGLLIFYIEGLNLWAAVEKGDLQSEEDLFDVTYRIIHLAAELEQRKFYHVDMRCNNIIRRYADGEIFFIDFAGCPKGGWYREDRGSAIRFEGPEASDALFILGRTLWELWAADGPWKGAPIDRIQNETVRNIIKDCEEGNVESIFHLSEKYSPRHVMFSEVHA